MGRIVTKIKVVNFGDVLFAQQGQKPIDDIRSIEMEALVDTGATLLCLPPAIIANLGLSYLVSRKAVTANGTVERKIFGGAQLTIMGRTCTVDVMELPEGVPALVGYIPLENLDLQVDPKGQSLIPAHGEEVVMDLLINI